jgi:hypothetical protein
LGAARVRRLVWGTPEFAAVPKPDHKLFETHPVINSRWPYEVARGAIAVKPDVAELSADGVCFTDGTSEPFDVIICATGFMISFPFVDVSQLNWQAGRPDLFLNVFHPERDDLFVAGLIQPTGGQFGLVDYQAQLIAHYLVGLENGQRAARQLQSQKRHDRPELTDGARFVNTPRHLLEVDQCAYRRLLRQWIGRFGQAEGGRARAEAENVGQALKAK